MAVPIIPLVVAAGRIGARQIGKIMLKRVGKANVLGLSTIGANVAGGAAGIALEQRRKARKKLRRKKKRKVKRIEANP